MCMDVGEVKLEMTACDMDVMRSTRESGFSPFSLGRCFSKCVGCQVQCGLRMELSSCSVGNVHVAPMHLHSLTIP
jgi:hypothetical protein